MFDSLIKRIAHLKEENTKMREEYNILTEGYDIKNLIHLQKELSIIQNNNIILKKSLDQVKKLLEDNEIDYIEKIRKGREKKDA